MLISRKVIDLAAQVVVVHMLQVARGAPPDLVVHAVRAAYVLDQGRDLAGADITDEVMQDVLDEAGRIAGELAAQPPLDNVVALESADSKEDRFAKFVRRQFPLRPSGPDQDRLREVVEYIEGWKRQGINPSVAYRKFMDLEAVGYLAANRGMVDYPRAVPDQYRQAVLGFSTSAWMEGFLFGLLFERIGGHREGE